MAEGGPVQLTLSSEQKIVKQGWLSKRGEYIKNWRQRYFFLLTDGMLLGFKTKPINDLSNPLNNFTVKVNINISYSLLLSNIMSYPAILF